MELIPYVGYFKGLCIGMAAVVGINMSESIGGAFIGCIVGLICGAALVVLVSYCFYVTGFDLQEWVANLPTQHDGGAETFKTVFSLALTVAGMIAGNVLYDSAKAVFVGGLAGGLSGMVLAALLAPHLHFLTQG